MSISDMIGQKNESFGVRNYSIPKCDAMPPKIPLGKVQKGKNQTFIEQILEKKKRIPGPGYLKIDNWSTLLPKNAGMFPKQVKVTETAEIMKKNAKLPSPNSYNPQAWRTKAEVKRIIGNYKQKDEIVTFAQESINLYGETPLNKYDPMVLDKIKKKPRYTIINKDIERFSKTKPDRNSPSSATYETL